MAFYHIKTFGCQMNFSDSERIRTLLEDNGFQPLSEDGVIKDPPSEELKKVDLLILTTCGVRKSAEDRAFGLIHNFRKINHNAKIVITGCLSERGDVHRKMAHKVDAFFPITKINEVLNLFKLDQEKIDFENYLQIQPTAKFQDSIYVPIMTGCNNFCSYCVVPYARGREWSRPYEEIEKEIGNSLSNKLQKVLLLGQNVNSYKSSQENLDFPQLLEKLAVKFPQIHFNFLTSHPKDFSDQLIQVIAHHSNISREIHLPIQSGSDQILKKMNRPYTQTHYLNLVKKIKQTISRATISTDVIIGFPGETEEDLEQTAKVFEIVGFKEAFFNKYSLRPGTDAEKLGDPISQDTKKNREKILRKIFNQKRFS